MKKMILLCYLLLLSLCGFSATSDTKTSSRYQVELIIFQRLVPAALEHEVWPSYPPLPNTSKAVTLRPASIDDENDEQNYQLLPLPTWQLQAEAQHLRRSKHYRLLGHLAWQQIISKPRFAQPVHIQLQSDESSDAPWQLDGTLTLSHLNYISVSANLLLSLPRTSLNNASIPNRDIVQFRLVQKHRMRVKELYYFDQPLFGFLIQVTPL